MEQAEHLWRVWEGNGVLQSPGEPAPSLSSGLCGWERAGEAEVTGPDAIRCGFLERSLWSAWQMGQRWAEGCCMVLVTMMITWATSKDRAEWIPRDGGASRSHSGSVMWPRLLR